MKQRLEAHRARPRPLLVRAYAALFSDAGLLSPQARRRALRFLGRSAPAAVVTAVAALLALGAFARVVFGPVQAVALAALAIALGAALWRRAGGSARGETASYRAQLELGALALVAAYAVVQCAGGAGESPLQPLAYLVLAFLVALHERAVGSALVALAVLLEALLWGAGAASRAALVDRAVHVAFLVLFAVLYHAVLAAQVLASRRSRRAAEDRQKREYELAARQFRLLSGGGAGADGADDPVERERRWTEGAVVEIAAAVSGALEVAQAALQSDTCALYWLSDDGKALTLRDCRSGSEAIAAGPLPAGEGALGGAVKRASPVRLSGDVKPPSYYLDGTRPASLVAVPVVDRRGAAQGAGTAGGHVRGVLVADRLRGEPFGEADEQLLVTLASEILRAVDAERLMRDVRETRAQSDRFYQAIQRLNRARKLSEVLDELLGVAREMVPADLAAVALVEEEDAATVRVARVFGAGEVRGAARLDGLTFPLSQGLVGAAIVHQAVLPHAAVDPAKVPIFGEVALKGLAALRIVPIKAGEQVVGALVVGSQRSEAYARGDLVQQLEVVAMQAGQSIERARLFDRTERLATTDGLTGLTNHRTFQERLDAHLAQAQRYGKRLSLILCDVDHFKSVNDTYGHPVGDQVLKGVARTLVKEARATDVVARYGGEEFAVVMPETDTAGALVIAERIREKVGQVVLETPQGPLRVTISLGVATFPDDGQPKAALIERADACLYQAKRAGRNRSVAAATLRQTRRVSG